MCCNHVTFLSLLFFSVLFLKESDNGELASFLPHQSQSSAAGGDGLSGRTLTVAGWGVTTNNVRQKIRNFRDFGAGTKTMAAYDVPVLEVPLTFEFLRPFLSLSYCSLSLLLSSRYELSRNLPTHVIPRG